MLGFAVSLVPQCDLAGLATVILLAIAFLVINANIPLDFNCLVDSQPSHYKIQKLVT